MSNLRIYADTNNNGGYDAGADTLITYLDQVAADANIRVFVVADVPLGRSTDDVAGVRLTGTAAEATAAGSLGAVVTQTAGANTAGVDTVFADTNADGNTARDGIHFDEDDYTIFAANLTATKTSRVISDPLNGTTNPKLIPGAVVEYCISRRQCAPAARRRANVAISDTLPAPTTYDADVRRQGQRHGDERRPAMPTAPLPAPTPPAWSAARFRASPRATPAPCCSASRSTRRGLGRAGACPLTSSEP